MVIEAGDDGAGIGAQFRAEGVGIGFEGENVAVGTGNFILIDCALVELRQEYFPEARGAARAHGMDAAVPTIEVAHDADAFCAGRPNGEVNAAHAIERNHMGAEFFISVIVAALDHKVKLQLAEDDRKGIRIENLKGIAEMCASLNLVTARRGRRGLPRRPSSFAKPLRPNFQSVRHLLMAETTA